MKKVICLLLLLVTVAVVQATADEITFSFVRGLPGTLVANTSGLTTGVGANFAVTDNTKGVTLPFNGFVSATTGTANSFAVFPTLILASYSAGKINSLEVLSSSLVPLVLGTISDNAAFVGKFPNGGGAFLSHFDVTYVNPLIPALFGITQGFSEEGSVAATFANINFSNGTAMGDLGGGAVTITTVPEVSTMLLFGTSLLTVVRFVRRHSPGCRV